MENNLISLQTQIDFKNKQIKNLQNKLDSQDIIIQDYYSIKDKYVQSQIEISNLKKSIQNLNLKIPSVSNQLSQKDIENQKLKNINMQLSKELNDLKMKSNSFHSSQNKLEKEIKEYKKHELLFNNLQIENEILNSKIINLEDIETKSEKVIEDLKDMNKKINMEKEDIIKEKNGYEIKLKFETQKNKELLDINHVLIEDKKKLTNEITNINTELNNLKNNINLLNIENKNISDDLNTKSRMLSEITIKKNELEKEINTYKEKMDNNNQIIQKENEKYKNMEKSIDEMKKQILKYKEQNIELNN